MKIAVIDDRKEDRDKLSDLLREQLNARGYSLTVTCFPDGESFLKQFSCGTYDIIFLDIYMKELTGIETAQEVRRLDQNVRLIFCTTSNEFASESYSVRADDYILKPYAESTLMRVFDKLSLEKLEEQRMLRLPDGQSVRITHILYTTLAGHYVNIRMKDGSVIRVRMTQGEFARLLQPYPEFVSCNRGMLINFRRVAKLERDDFLMEGGDRVPISRRRIAEVKKQYGGYLTERMRRGGGD